MMTSKFWFRAWPFDKSFLNNPHLKASVTKDIMTQTLSRHTYFHCHYGKAIKTRISCGLFKNFPNVIWGADLTMQDLNYWNKKNQRGEEREEELKRKNRKQAVPEIIPEALPCAINRSPPVGTVNIWLYAHCHVSLDSCRTSFYNCALTCCKGCSVHRNGNRGISLQGK